MPGYADIGGSWRELNGGGYANIGGSWRQISEGYQNRGGTWEKVFPNYKDYGGDTPDILANGYVDRYGYSRSYSSDSSLANAATQSTKENSTTNSVYGNNINTRRYDFFSTNEPLDARGYNYLVFIYGVDLRTTRTDYESTHNFTIRPFVSFSSSQNIIKPSGDDDRLIRGSEDSTRRVFDVDYYYTACTFVDISNIATTDLYLLTGYALYSDYSSGSYYPEGRLDASDGYGLVKLYKNKSDCTINGSDYTYSWTLTY